MSPEKQAPSTILIIDDDACLRALVASILGAAGFTVTEAPTGEEGIAAARTARPALVLLDVRLPRISGYEVCRALRDELGAELPIVFLSGERTEPLDRVAGLLLGADDYLAKPFAPDELLARVRRLLRPTPHDVAPLKKLTPREQQVLTLLTSGIAQEEMAARLFISSNTVAHHIEHILGKLEVHSRAQAVALALGPETPLGQPAATSADDTAA